MSRDKRLWKRVRAVVKIWKKCLMLTLKFHSDFQALLETAVGTPFALSFVDVAASLRDARIHLLVLNGALEEALAGLARQKTVVISRYFVAAYRATLFDKIAQIGLIA